MRTTLSKRALRTFVVMGVGVCLVAGACGDDDGGEDAAVAGTGTGATSSAAAASESPYCDLARAWAVSEMSPVDDSDPAAVRAYWGEYLTFVEQARDLSPEPVQAQWAVGANAVGTLVVPVLEKYDYTYERLMSEGTDAEKALFEDPPAEVVAAQNDVLRYESEVCAAQQPLAADVTFAAEEPGPYCEAIVAGDEMVGEVFATGGTPEGIRELLTDGQFQAVLDQQTASAPAEIGADVVALDAWHRDRQVPVWEKYGYDLRKILLEGEQADRAVIQSSDPAIRDHYARALAYEEQVCGQ